MSRTDNPNNKPSTMPASRSLTEAPFTTLANRLPSAAQSSQSGRLSSSSSPSPIFKLRPRSNSHSIAEVSPLVSTSDAPLVHGVHTISPDGPMHPSARNSGGDREQFPSEAPTSAFASFFGSGACSSPVKKQKVRDRLRLKLSPAASPSDESQDSREDSALGSPPVAFSAAVGLGFPSLDKFPSTPTDEEVILSNGKRSLPPDEGDSHSALPTASQGNSSPFTPEGRHMMQNLCINSPSPSLSSMSPTPQNSNRSQPELINQQPPTIPCFSFSPSSKLEKDCIFPRKESNRSITSNSPLMERIVFSVGSTPVGTPDRCPKGSVASSATSSPFYSLRGHRTPIGHQRGSVFKMLPPRVYPNGRDENVGSVASVNENAYASSSRSASPSPRVVPLTVLSKDGSPFISPKLDPVPSGMPSPLMRSLDLAKDESKADLLLEDVKIPNISKVQSSPLSSGTSQQLLPRIKLTPRGKNRFVPARQGPSPGGDDGGLAMPRYMLSGSQQQYAHDMIKTASSFVTDCHGDKEAAEMDSLLNGFGHHKSFHSKEDLTQDLKNDSFGRVESEEAEIASLTQGPLPIPTFWIPPSAVSQEKDDHLCSQSSFTCSDGDASYFSPGNRKPMPSITLNLRTEHEDSPNHPCITSPSFLPRPLPIAQNKSRSLFDLSNARDPLERIIQADAIAEAAKSNEPLTDEDSDIDGDDAGFLLCLPQASQDNMYVPKSTKMCRLEKKIQLKSNCAGFRTESPSLKLRAEGFRAESPSLKLRVESPLFNKSRSGSFSMRRCKCSGLSLHGLSSPTAPTIFEEGSTNLYDSMTNRPFQPQRTHDGLGLESCDKRETSDATFMTFCSLSDCDASDIMASPKYSRTKALGSQKDRQSVCSLLSMSSLCGLDIVHEASSGVEAVDKVPMIMPSASLEFSANMFKPMPSELSTNSLGLSLDSADAGMDQRDLFTPPVVGMAMPNSKHTLSPPPLRCCATSPLDTYHRWNL